VVKPGRTVALIAGTLVLASATAGWLAWGRLAAATNPPRRASIVPNVPAECGVDAQAPPAKQDFERRACLDRVAAELGPRAPKIPSSYSPVACPQIPAPARVHEYHPSGSELDHQSTDLAIVNAADLVASDGFEYSVTAGARRSNAQRGVLVLYKESLEPCLAPLPDAEHRPYFYDSPAASGALTIVAIKGDDVEYKAGSGKGGFFNVVRRQYRPQDRL
jgi:hypothetical protein